MISPQAEAVFQSLKNILLVMSSQGILVAPSCSDTRPGPVGSGGEDSSPNLSNATEPDMWTITWGCIDEFCPELKEEFASVLHKVSSLQSSATIDREECPNGHIETLNAPTERRAQTPPPPATPNPSSPLQESTSDQRLYQSAPELHNSCAAATADESSDTGSL